jgi:hypothetical protein
MKPRSPNHPVDEEVGGLSLSRCLLPTFIVAGF